MQDIRFPQKHAKFFADSIEDDVITVELYDLCRVHHAHDVTAQILHSLLELEIACRLLSLNVLQERYKTHIFDPLR